MTLIWFILLDRNGQPYKGTTESSVSLSPKSFVDQFRHAVYLKNSSILPGVVSSQLQVYKNKSAFDNRNAVGEKEKPLEVDSYIDNLGNSKKESLVVLVPEVQPSPAQPAPTFADYLKRENINSPKENVLSIIATCYPQQMRAAMEIGSSGPCVDLYRMVEGLPSSYTRGVIEKDMAISINGPLSLERPNVLTAVDMGSGCHICLKLLRLPGTVTSQSTVAKKDAIETEISTCSFLTAKNIEGLVKCDVVDVTVHHSEGLDVSPGVWRALRMKRFMCSLNQCPQLSEHWLYQGFTRILNALKEMHKLDIVHMDVKPDNLFVDDNLVWNLGDFGSARKIGVVQWSFTCAFNPYKIPEIATVIPEMDLVLLCVTIAVELDKKNWKKSLCGPVQNVQQDLVLAKLESIKNEQFRREVVELFQNNLKIVLTHLQKYHDF